MTINCKAYFRKARHACWMNKMRILQHFWEFEDEKPSKYYILHFRDVKMLKMFQKWYCPEILRAAYVQKKP